MKYYTSGRNFTFKEAEKEFQTDAKCEMNLIKAYPKITYQEILGMGGALTESAAYTYAQMSPEKQKELLDLYFGKTETVIISGVCIFRAAILHLETMHMWKMKQTKN